MNYPIDIGIPTIFDSLFLFPIFSTMEFSFRFLMDRSTETDDFRDEVEFTGSRFVTFVTALFVTILFEPCFPTLMVFRLVATANQLLAPTVVPVLVTPLDVVYFIVDCC